MCELGTKMRELGLKCVSWDEMRELGRKCVSFG